MRRMRDNDGSGFRAREASETRSMLRTRVQEALRYAIEAA